MTKINSACAVVFLLPTLALAGDYERGVEALDKKDSDLAIACFTAHIRENPKDNKAFNKRGNAFADKKEFDKAIEDYNEAIRLDPEDAKVYSNRGNSYLGKKENDKAIQDYSQAIRIDPKYAVAYINRGNAYYDKKEWDKAIDDYSQVIRLDPKHALAYVNRGNAYSDKKEWEKSIEDYSQAILLDSKYADAYNGVAWVLATCPKDSVRNGKNAVEYGTKACELSHWRDANFIGTLAEAYAERGDFKEAVKWEKKALEVGYGSPEETTDAKMRLKLYEAGKPFREK